MKGVISCGAWRQRPEGVRVARGVRSAPSKVSKSRASLGGGAQGRSSR